MARFFGRFDHIARRQGKVGSCAAKFALTLRARRLSVRVPGRVLVTVDSGGVQLQMEPMLEKASAAGAIGTWPECGRSDASHELEIDKQGRMAIPQRLPGVRPVW